MFKWFEARTPREASLPVSPEAAPAEADALAEAFSPPEVIQGQGDDADWALWDECVAALDALVAQGRAQASPEGR